MSGSRLFSTIKFTKYKYLSHPNLWQGPKKPVENFEEERKLDSPLKLRQGSVPIGEFLKLLTPRVLARWQSIHLINTNFFFFFLRIKCKQQDTRHKTQDTRHNTQNPQYTIHNTQNTQYTKYTIHKIHNTQNTQYTKYTIHKIHNTQNTQYEIKYNNYVKPKQRKVIQNSNAI